MADGQDSPKTGGAAVSASTPSPLVSKGHPVDWWFVFKLNAGKFPGCGEDAERSCAFGGSVQNYRSAFGQQFVYATSDNESLTKGSGCAGTTTLNDPIGATFDELYNRNDLYYVVWNDQFYGNPQLSGCTSKGNCMGPWGHSKGMLAWDKDGNGFLMQVTTPSWPGSGSSLSPRTGDGNTLGCVKDNDVEVSQDFFSLKLDEDDVVKVLNALANASVVTSPKEPETIRNGGPRQIKGLVGALGVKSMSRTFLDQKLSSGIEIISKPRISMCHHGK
jgi:hypothetical protein